MVEYLRSYGSGLDVDIRTGHQVQTVTALLGEGFRITTTSGVGIAADTVIAATGGFGHPHVPGMAGFAGRIMHAADYRAPGRFSGHRVIVVGGGNSAVQIAADLTGAARVILATRGPLRPA